MNAIIQKALQSLSHHVATDTLCVLNESEFQSRIYLELCKHTVEDVPVCIPHAVIFPNEFREKPMCRRVFREMVLDPSLGRSSPRPDILLFKHLQLVGVPKQNGAISSWQGQFDAIIEIKFNVTARKSVADREKYPIDRHESLYCINYRPKQSGTKILSDDYVEFGGVGTMRNELSKRVDVREIAIESIQRVHKMHMSSPASMIREKDFESWLSRELELIIGKDGCQVVQDGRTVGSTTSVRNQITAKKFPERRHDILIVDALEYPKGVGKVQNILRASVEIEIKTSNSNSHNWFDGRINDEFEKMVKFKQIFGGLPIFVMFRLGSPIFVEDYNRTVKKYPDIKFMYLCSNGEVL